jgi:hypothetical protein
MGFDMDTALCGRCGKRDAKIVSNHFSPTCDYPHMLLYSFHTQPQRDVKLCPVVSKFVSGRMDTI